MAQFKKWLAFLQDRLSLGSTTMVRLHAWCLVQDWKGCRK